MRCNDFRRLYELLYTLIMAQTLFSLDISKQLKQPEWPTCRVNDGDLCRLAIEVNDPIESGGHMWGCDPFVHSVEEEMKVTVGSSYNTNSVTILY